MINAERIVFFELNAVDVSLVNYTECYYDLNCFPILQASTRIFGCFWFVEEHIPATGQAPQELS